MQSRLRCCGPGDGAHRAQVSPYLTGHVERFGEYSTRELGIQAEAYDAALDVDCTQLRGEESAVSGFGAAAWAPKGAVAAGLDRLLLVARAGRDFG
ncbi:MULTISPECIES: hypothetical protein [unclassified Streptomyces]|uniref:hypothetical protein n=1 Tax=unclassified Streptomyces TaxID=2593676 RepID=UPI00344B4F0F